MIFIRLLLLTLLNSLNFIINAYKFIYNKLRLIKTYIKNIV